ncbi:hypothetical protein M8J77_008130 [Diaphorina citri]|nr:hypothetical protein M8J77_008130 [Diaphorina citri]
MSGYSPAPSKSGSTGNSRLEREEDTEKKGELKGLEYDGFSSNRVTRKSSSENSELMFYTDDASNGETCLYT